MRVLFFHSDKPRERILAEAFVEGARAHGDQAEMRPLPGEPDTEFDIACMVGVKSRELFHACARVGMRTLYLDKGYCRQRSESVTRSWEYWRVATGAHQPTRYLMKIARPDDRLNDLGLTLEPWRKDGNHVLIAGSSAKYHEFYGLSEPTKWARKTIAALNQLTDRPIVYRPKPSWRDASPIDGTYYSPADEPISRALTNAFAVVTHGSNSCFEAVLAGIPCIVLGDAVAKPISSTDLVDIAAPRLASDKERRQWLANLAYSQFTLSEFGSGYAWKIMRPQVYE